MQIRTAGQTGFPISAIGVGAWAIGGGGYAYGWGPQDDQESVATIRAALDAGINWIDTAPVYGLGHSEEVVARALEGVTPRPYVFTKCGLLWNPQGQISRNLTKDSIRHEIEASLRRLRTEVIDLYQVHWPDPDSDIEEAWDTLVRLQREGKTKQIGVSNFSVPQLKRLQAIAPVATIQPPYSLLAREVEREILPYAAAQGIAVISYSPMKSGLLSGAMTRARIVSMPPDDFRRSATEFREPRLSRNLGLVEVLREIGRSHGCSAGEIAIAWVLRNSAITGAIVGIRSAAQVSAAVRAAQIELTQDDLQRVNAFLANMRPGPWEEMIASMKSLVRRILSH